MQDTIYLYYSISILHGYYIFIYRLPVVTCAESNFSCSPSNKPSECIFYLSRLDTFSNIEVSVINLRKNYIATVITSQLNPNKVIFGDRLNTVLYFFFMKPNIIVACIVYYLEMLHVKELNLSLDIQCDSLCVKVFF